MKYKWRTYDVSGKPAGTIGYEDGDRMHLNLAKKLESIEEAGREEIFAVNVVSSCTAYVVTRELVPIE
jgi:hypothetical protein